MYLFSLRIKREDIFEMIHFFSRRLSYEYLYRSTFSERVKKYYVLLYLHRIIFSSGVKETIAFEMTHFFFRRLRETPYEYLYRSTFSERVKRYYIESCSPSESKEKLISN